MPRGRPRKNPDVLLKSAEMIGWALGGLEREIMMTKSRLTALTSQAAVLRKKMGTRATAAVASAAAEVKAVGSKRARKRRNLTPEARKAISERMTKRWADWRKRNKK